MKIETAFTYRAAHILLNTRHEAEDLLRKLNEGSDFAELARRFSSCSSAAAGGDLGELRKGKADPDFEEAVLTLKTGETAAKPLRTRFGYHLIRRLG